MIDGLRIEMKSAEVVAHCLSRAAMHREKAETYAKRIAAVGEAMGEVAVASNDPAFNMKGKLDHHRKQLGFFSFIAEHVVPDDVYRLTEEDLGRLEIASRYY